MLTRRSLLLGAVCAPAVVRAESLMKIWVPREPEVWIGVIEPFTMVTSDFTGEVWGESAINSVPYKAWQESRNRSGLAMLMLAEQQRQAAFNLRWLAGGRA